MKFYAFVGIVILLISYKWNSKYILKRKRKLDNSSFDKLKTEKVDSFYTTLPSYFRDYSNNYNSYLLKNRILYYSPHGGAGLGNRLGALITLIVFSFLTKRALVITGWPAFNKMFKIPIILSNRSVGKDNLKIVNASNYTSRGCIMVADVLNDKSAALHVGKIKN